MSRTDVLNLEWRSFPSRDRDASTLVANYLRLAGLSVVEGCVFEGYELIRRLKPKLLFISNSIGAEINLKLIKYAKSRGVLCISGSAEGNFRREGIEEFVWGHNREHVLYEDRLLLWSEQARSFTLEAFPELEGRVGVSGGVGFDLYRMIQPNRDWLWERTGGRNYQKVVGVGCWDFGITSPDDPRYSYFLDYYGEEAIRFFRKERDVFNQVLLELAGRNADVLFLLKEHPGRRQGYWASAIEGCEELPNVVIERNGVSIKDCLQVSDVWISFESNTAMEAWLYGIPTGLLNPGGTDFPNRHEIHKGQPNFINADQWHEAIHACFSTGILPGFDAKAEVRERIIRHTIQWNDGLNHVRFGNSILDLIEQGDSCTPAAQAKSAPRYPTAKERLREWLLWNGSPSLKAFSRPFANYWAQYRGQWDARQLAEFGARLMDMQQTFYRENDLDERGMRRILPL